MMQHNKLLDKYYKGETSLKEEQELKYLIKENCEDSAEQNIFNYFEQEAKLPEGLEDDMFKAIGKSQTPTFSIRKRIYSMVSVAALVAILLSIFLDFRTSKETQLEDDFFVMEKALFQVSESLQPPQEDEEMLVLWVDNNVEIIVN